MIAKILFSFQMEEIIETSRRAIQNGRKTSETFHSIARST